MSHTCWRDQQVLRLSCFCENIGLQNVRRVRWEGHVTPGGRWWPPIGRIHGAQERSGSADHVTPGRVVAASHWPGNTVINFDWTRDLVPAG